MNRGLFLRRKPRQRRRAALVLSGGGITAAAYEIGCLAALDRRFGAGFSNHFFDLYVGVSAGSIIASLIANQVSPGRLFQALADDDTSIFNFKRSDIYRFNSWGLFASCWEAVRELARVARHYDGKLTDLSLTEVLHIVQEQLPSGLFSLAPLRDYMQRIFEREGLSDDFKTLPAALYVPAIDLDRGQRSVFGSDGLRDVPISEAVPASCAIPTFFRPYQIGDRFYIDGCASGHAPVDVAIEQGATLVVVVNPLVPLDNAPEHRCLPSVSSGAFVSLSALGIGRVGEQSLRVDGKERMETMLAKCRREHPEVEIVVLEPRRSDTLMFLQSPMSFGARRQVMEYGFNLTVQELAARRDWFEQLLVQQRWDVRGDAALAS